MPVSTVAEALIAATHQLAASSAVAPPEPARPEPARLESERYDAELLMAHALRVTRSELLLHHMRAPVPAGFAPLIARRLAHEPVAYILQNQPFWGLDLIVGPAVLIPRGDSETLIAAALAACAAHPPARVIDLGTGSGALLLAALSQWPAAHGIGIDRSSAALGVARANAAALGMGARATMVAADWHGANWAAALGRFDLVLANPPYVETGAVLERSVVEHEPHGALFAGADGLNDLRALIPQLPRLMNQGGVALVEIGWTQGAAVTALAAAAGLRTKLHHDLGGRPRAVEMTAAPARL